MIAVGQVGNGHRRLALTVQLHQARTQFLHGATQILGQNRRTAIDQRVQRSVVVAIHGGRIDQPLHHDRCGKKIGDPVGLDRLQHTFGIERRRFQNNMGRCFADIGQGIEPTAMRERSRVQDHLIRAETGTHIGIEILGHSQQIAMSQHRTLRHARGAGCVEEPGDILRIDLGHDIACRFALQQGLVGQDIGMKRLHPDVVRYPRQAIADRGNGLAKRIGSNDGPSLGVVDDIGHLAGMEAKIERDNTEAGLKTAENRLQHFGAVVHQYRHPVAICKAQATQGPSQAIDPGIELRIGPPSRTMDQSQMLGGCAGRLAQQIADIHRIRPL